MFHIQAIGKLGFRKDIGLRRVSFQKAAMGVRNVVKKAG